jgi:SIR2-like domain
MSFASLAQPAVGPIIDRFGDASKVSLIVGAGASMEASLPSWRELVRRLLTRVAEENSSLTTQDAKDDWVRRTLAREDLLAAGAVVEVMANDDLDDLLPRELYGPDGPTGYEPGPIADQIAYLRGCFGDRLAILTTNYDDLIERALEKRQIAKGRIKSYVTRRKKLPQGVFPVTHLHGFAGREGPPKQLVLTEEHYHRMQRGSSWQERYVTECLESSLCLFIGTSLADPNLIRYLYGYKKKPGRKHAAVFVRQGDLDGVGDEVRRAQEDAAAKRWARQGVDAIFVDHFGDAAQLLYEIGLRNDLGTDYRPVEERARLVLKAMEDIVFKVGDQAAFAGRQVQLSGWLRNLLYSLIGTALDGGDLPDGERLAIALWMLSADGTTVTAWAHSDRAHQDPATIEALPVVSESQWVAVRTICQGVRVDLDLDRATSRWRFVRGLPIVFDDPTRLPIGCVTISSTKSGTTSALSTLPAGAKSELHRGLVRAIEDVLGEIPKHLEG